MYYIFRYFSFLHLNLDVVENYYERIMVNLHKEILHVEIFTHFAI